MRRVVRRVVCGLGLSVALVGTGCSFPLGGKAGEMSYPLQVARSVPAATGKLKVTPEGGNRALQLKVEHMAPPDLAHPGANFYVVWLKPEGSDQPTNAGILPVGEDRKGQFR